MIITKIVQQRAELPTTTTRRSEQKNANQTSTNVNGERSCNTLSNTTGNKKLAIRLVEEE